MLLSLLVLVVVVVTTPHTDANSIQKDNHQLISKRLVKRQKGAPLSAPFSAYTKVDTFLFVEYEYEPLDELIATPLFTRCACYYRYTYSVWQALSDFFDFTPPFCLNHQKIPTPAAAPRDCFQK